MKEFGRIYTIFKGDSHGIAVAVQKTKKWQESIHGNNFILTCLDNDLSLLIEMTSGGNIFCLINPEEKENLDDWLLTGSEFVEPELFYEEISRFSTVNCH